MSQFRRWKLWTAACGSLLCGISLVAAHEPPSPDAPARETSSSWKPAKKTTSKTKDASKSQDRKLSTFTVKPVDDESSTVIFSTPKKIDFDNVAEEEEQTEAEPAEREAEKPEPVDSGLSALGESLTLGDEIDAIPARERVAAPKSSRAKSTSRLSKSPEPTLRIPERVTSQKRTAVRSSPRKPSSEATPVLSSVQTALLPTTDAMLGKRSTGGILDLIELPSGLASKPTTTRARTSSGHHPTFR